MNGSNSKVVDKLRTGFHTKSIIEDFGRTGKSINFSEESSRTSHEMDNIELHMLGHIQNHSIPILLDARAGRIHFLLYEEQIQRIITRFEVLIVPHCQARVNYSRGKRHGEAQWQKDDWKARDAHRGASKNSHDSIMLRCQIDEKCRESQKVRGWTEDYYQYLDHLTTIDISYSATWHQRNRYENTIVLVGNDDDRQAGPMRAREDFRSTTHNLTVLQREQGRQNSHIPKNERARQRPFNEALRADLEWHTNGGNTNTKTLNGQTNIGGQSDGYRLFQSHTEFFSLISRTDISECRARDRW